MADLNDQKLSLFQRLFGVRLDPNARGMNRMMPIRTVKDPKTGQRKTANVKFSSAVQQLYTYWLNACHDQQIDYLDRKKLWEDMDLLFYNSPLLSRAMKLTADEVVQADSNAQPLGLECKDPKFEDFALDFFDNVRVYKYLHPTALSIIQYGNDGWMLAFSNKGVEEIIPTDVFNIEDRFEFTPTRVQEELKKKGSLFAKLQGMQRIDALIKSVSSTEDYTSMFRSFLFGFQVSGMMIPPWRFLHFRNFTSKSPFAPFGVPLYVHAIAPYRQFDAAMSLQVVARGARLPIDKYSLNIPNTLNPTNKLELAIEFINELDNSGLKDTKKEGIGVGERIVTLRDLFDWDQIAPNIDIGKMDDIDLLRDDLIIATGLPRAFLDPDSSAFGNSGISLIQQFKPFARLCHHIQSIELENITQLLKIHAIQSGNYALADIDFRLTMPYPESNNSSEITSSQNDALNLANSVLDALADKVMGGASASQLPYEVVKQVYTQFLPWDQKRIGDLVDLTHAGKQSAPEEETEEGERKPLKGIKWDSNQNALRVLKEEAHLACFDLKQKKLKEGVYNGKHYYSSRNQYLGFPAEKLRELDATRLEMLKEADKNESKKRMISLYNKEEVHTYVFKPSLRERIAAEKTRLKRRQLRTSTSLLQIEEDQLQEKSLREDNDD